ncbi:hypothetical protein [Segatella buccae]|uniref:hypothetical protein n=1 Tax=Segatella buccae TaxID=28126 RepID=UPI0022E78A1D|nr:hypothetical protein [Segatella buccae]
MKIILVAAFPMIFCTVFFTTVDTNANECGWMSFAFVLLSYVLLLSTRLAARFPKGMNVLNMNLWSISITYFIVTVVTDLVFIYGFEDSKVPCLLLNLLYLLLYIVVYTLSYLSNKNIANEESSKL